MATIKLSPKNYSEIVFWTLAPLTWGIITWIFAFGPFRQLIGDSVRMGCGIIIASLYFYRPLTVSSLTTIVSLFGYKLSIPRWIYLVALSLFLLSAHFLYTTFVSWETPLVINSLVFGVCASAVLEELLARSIIIKYQMSGIAFLSCNILSSVSMTLMHAGFQSPIPTLYTLFFINGHFMFSFMLGIVAYKTRRIELPILLHAASNFFRYTLPRLIIGQDLPLISLVLDCVFLLIIGFATKTEKTLANNKYQN